jgi:hypothetical protein
MRGLRPVNAAWKVPTILTDASLQIELVRHLWPDMKLAGDIAVEARHQHIRQIIDRSYGLSSLDANDSTIADPGTVGDGVGMMIALGADQPAVGELVHRVDALIPLPVGKPCARRAGQCLGTGLDRGRRWRLPSDDDDPRHLTETVDAGYRAVVQPFDVAWQRTDGLDLRDDALLRDSKQDAGRGESGLAVQLSMAARIRGWTANNELTAQQLLRL